MSPRSALSLASLLLALLAACPARSVASPRPEPMDESLPENPAPTNIRAPAWRAGSFQATQPAFHKALYSSSRSVAAPCDCPSAPAQPRNVAFTLTTYSSNANFIIDVPRIPGAPNAPIGSAHWTPEHLYSPLVGGFRLGQRKVDQIFTRGLFGTVPSNLRSVLHLSSASGR